MQTKILMANLCKALNFHFGGEFVFSPSRKYVGGQVEKFEVGINTMKLIELQDLVEQLNCPRNSMLSFRVEGDENERGLFRIETDYDVQAMIDILYAYGSLDVYIEQQKSNAYKENPIFEVDDEGMIDEYGASEFVECREYEESDCESYKKNCRSSDDDEFPDEGEIPGILVPCEYDNIGLESSNESRNVVQSEKDSVRLEDANKLFSQVQDEENYDSDNSEHLGSPRGLDDDEKNKYLIYDEKRDLANPKIVLGMIFPSLAVVRNLVREYHIKEGWQVCFPKNEKKRLVAKCSQKCGWGMRASPFQGTGAYQIKSINGKHKCGRIYVNRNATSTWLARKYQEDFTDDPSWKTGAVQKRAMRDYMLNVSKMQVYRARHKVMEATQGSYGEQFRRLRDYCEMIRYQNPRSSASLHVEVPWLERNVVRFQRIFISYTAQYKGFLDGCRPIIGLDACHLSGPYGGICVHAVARDGNDQMFPLALAVVEAENKSSWTWFLNNLLAIIGRSEEKGWIFISDQIGKRGSYKLLINSCLMWSIDFV